MATTVRPATLRIYRQSITACVLPALGHRRLVDLDPLLLTTSTASSSHGAAGVLPADLTFPDWDTSERGPREAFSSRSVQPTPPEDVRRADG